MERLTGCSECESYSYPLSRCIHGKLNPPTIKGGLEAAEFMGIRYICTMTVKGHKTIQQWLKNNKLETI